MSSSDGTARTTGPDDPPQRVLAPIRWPHPGRASYALLLVWLAAMVVAVLTPALVVPPGTGTASGVEVLGAFGLTMAGAVVMSVVGFKLHAMHREPIALMIATVAPGTVVAGGIIMAAVALAR